MIFSIGTKVQLKSTGDSGRIEQLLDNDMVVVRLDDSSMNIPVFPEDLIRVEEMRPGKPTVKATVVPGKKENEREKPDYLTVQPEYTILKSMGIQLGFEALSKKDNSIYAYAIHLINDTRQDVVFDIKISILEEEEIIPPFSDKLMAMSTLLLGELAFDKLNDNPVVAVDCWPSLTSGLGEKQSKSIKIKPKQFFKKVITAPLLTIPVHHYILFDKLEGEKAVDDVEDLKSYTRRNHRFTEKNEYRKFSSAADPGERASFSPELDLHIEKLVASGRKLTNADKLRIQLNAFDKYLGKAIRFGVPRVFIIHGLGKGRLKNEIASRLFQNPDVISFKNEFHPAYGWGATEVIL